VFLASQVLDNIGYRVGKLISGANAWLKLLNIKQFLPDLSFLSQIKLDLKKECKQC